MILGPGYGLKPIETYIYLTDLKRLRAGYTGHPGYISYRKNRFDQDLDELIEANNITPQKCNTRYYLELNTLISLYSTQNNSLYSYLKYQKKKLDRFCAKVHSSKYEKMMAKLDEKQGKELN